MGFFDNWAPRRRRQTTQPKTVGESFWINFLRSLGRAMGGRFGRALSGPKRRRRRYW